MIQYVVTAEEMQSLLDQLELVALRKKAEHAPQSAIHRQDIDDLHRTFHMYVTRWVQAMGYRGHR